MKNRNQQNGQSHVIALQPPLKERTARDLFAYSDGQLEVTDPLEMNLLVAKEIPHFSHLDISPYKHFADSCATEVKYGLREAEEEFHRTPEDWKNDLAFFRLGYLCWYVDKKLGIRYREDQKDLQAVRYTNPDDLFLNGVIDTRRGTCANMAALHVAIGWRLRWPVSLACVASHLICRYDDGKVTHNIEATKTGGGGFHSHPDDYYLKVYNLPRKAVDCGSDLRALTPREMLGVFIGFRARHYDDTAQSGLAEDEYLLARSLFPQSRNLQFAQIMSSMQNGMDLFEPWERGHPVELASWLREVVRLAPWELRPSFQEKEISNAGSSYKEYSYELSGCQSSAPG
jgi:Transglutaminase-like superfamily